MRIDNPNVPTAAKVPGIPSGNAWIDGYSAPRDSHVKHLTTALQGQIGFENRNDELRELTVKHGVETIVTAQKIKGKIVGASLLAWSLADDVMLRPRLITENKIGLTFTAVGGDPGEPFNVSVELRGP